MMDFLGHVTRHTPFLLFILVQIYSALKSPFFQFFFFFAFLTISTKFIELVEVFENYLFSVNCNRFIFDRDWEIKYFKILRSI